MANLWTPAQVFCRSGREHPDHTAIVAGASRSSYARVDARTSSLTAAMAELGPGNGDRTAIIVPNPVVRRPDVRGSRIRCRAGKGVSARGRRRLATTATCRSC